MLLFFLVFTLPSKIQSYIISRSISRFLASRGIKKHLLEPRSTPPKTQCVCHGGIFVGQIYFRRFRRRYKNQLFLHNHAMVQYFTAKHGPIDCSVFCDSNFLLYPVWRHAMQMECANANILNIGKCDLAKNVSFLNEAS